MAVAFSANVTAWGALTGGPQSSGSFTPTASTSIFVGVLDGAGTGRTLAYSGSVNTPTAKIVLNDPTDGNTLGLAEVLSALGGSQTLTVNSSPSGDGVSGYAIIYSGVATTTYNSHETTGSTTPIGVATVVPAGSFLVGLCIGIGAGAGIPAGQANGGVTPTDRQTGTNGTVFAWSEWVGTGGSITPTWSGASNDWAVLQVVLTPASTTTTPVNLMGRQIYILP